MQRAQGCEGVAAYGHLRGAQARTAEKRKPVPFATGGAKGTCRASSNKPLPQNRELRVSEPKAPLLDLQRHLLYPVLRLITTK